MFLGKEYISIKVTNASDNLIIAKDDEYLIHDYNEIGDYIKNIIQLIEAKEKTPFMRFEYHHKMDRTSIDYEGNDIDVFCHKAIETYKLEDALNFSIFFLDKSYDVEIKHVEHVLTSEEIKESKKEFVERQGKYISVKVCDVDAFIPVINEIILAEKSYDYINEIITLIETKTNSKFKGLYHPKDGTFYFNVYYESSDNDVEYLTTEDAEKYLKEVFNGEQIYHLFFVLCFDSGQYYNVTVKKEA